MNNSGIFGGLGLVWGFFETNQYTDRRILNARGERHHCFTQTKHEQVKYLEKGSHGPHSVMFSSVEAATE